MIRIAALLLLSTALWPQAASAAQANLNARQMHGRQILTQNCNLCHLPQDVGAKTYGPLLSKASANGDDALMRQVIENGLVKMPGWKYTLNKSDIDDLIAYIKTIPDPAAPAPR